jgi:hypothetical protein
MKLQLFLPVLVVIAPFASANLCAQTQQPATRAQVECELKELEAAGYHPSEDDFYYPRNLQAAQARLAQKNEARGLPPAGTCGGYNASADSTNTGGKQ